MRKTSNKVKSERRSLGLDIYGGLKKPQRKRLHRGPVFDKTVNVVIPDYVFHGLSPTMKKGLYSDLTNEVVAEIETGSMYQDAIDTVVQRLMELNRSR